MLKAFEPDVSLTLVAKSFKLSRNRPVWQAAQSPEKSSGAVETFASWNQWMVSEGQLQLEKNLG